MDFIVNMTQRNSPRRNRNNNQEDLIHMSRLNKKLFKEQIKDIRIIKILASIVFIQFIALLSLGIYNIILEGKNKKEDVPINLHFYNGSSRDINRELIINLFEVYKNKTGSENIPIQYILNDRYYRLPNYHFIKNFIKNDQTDNGKYILETNDCDNFSYIVFGNFLKYQLTFNLTHSLLFGVAYVENKNTSVLHLLNIFIDDRIDIYCLEPQVDEINFCNKTNYNIFRVIF